MGGVAVEPDQATGKHGELGQFRAVAVLVSDDEPAGGTAEVREDVVLYLGIAHAVTGRRVVAGEPAGDLGGPERGRGRQEARIVPSGLGGVFPVVLGRWARRRRGRRSGRRLGVGTVAESVLVVHVEQPVLLVVALLQGKV